MATNQPPEKVKCFLSAVTKLSRNENVRWSWMGKILQAIRMADVKAISDCRMLTLEAKDFVELLLVVWLILFLKTSNKHDPLSSQFTAWKYTPGPSACTSSGSLLFFNFSSSNAQSCFVSLFADPPWVQTQSSKVDGAKSWSEQEKCAERSFSSARDTSAHSRRASAREGLLESVWALQLSWWWNYARVRQMYDGMLCCRCIFTDCVLIQRYLTF